MRGSRSLVALVGVVALLACKPGKWGRAGCGGEDDVATPDPGDQAKERDKGKDKDKRKDKRKDKDEGGDEQAGAPPAPRAPGLPPKQVKVFGSAGTEDGQGLAIHRTGIYVVAETTGDLAGKNAGDSDAALVKFDRQGQDILWQVQFGTSAFDEARSVAVDDRGVYVVGRTEGALDGPGTGSPDIFLRHYSHDGALVRAEQFGTSKIDEALAVAVDNDGLYVTGGTVGSLGGEKFGTEDCFLRKYSLDGKEEWTRQFGTDKFEECTQIVLVRDGVFVSGVTGGSFAAENGGRPDAFAVRFSRSGQEEWRTQLGTDAIDWGRGIAVDAESIYIIGRTEGALSGNNLGNSDSYVVRLNRAGDQRLWLNQFGTERGDASYDVAVGAGGVWVVGGERGQMEKHGDAGGWMEAYIRQFGPDGKQLQHFDVSSDKDDECMAVAIDADEVWVVGNVDGEIGGTRAQGTDIFLARIQ